MALRNKFNTAVDLFKSSRKDIPAAIFSNITKTGVFNLLPDKQYLSIMYKSQTGRKLNLQNPETFNEKLQWLKLYDRNPAYVPLVDKYEVKKYIADKIGEEYIIPTLGVWDSVEDIDFDVLPKRYVLKCTHDSGSTIVCKDKADFDIGKAKKILNKKLHNNLFWWGREWPYKIIKPRIIAEKYMTNCLGGNLIKEELIDYKFMCFDGKVKCSFTCTERFTGEGLKVTFFDMDWNKLPFTRRYPASNRDIKKPEQYEKMIDLAEMLSTGIPFVRVDFYEVMGKVYFGEMTFYPGNGTEVFNPEKWDYILGSWIKLPERDKYTSWC